GRVGWNHLFGREDQKFAEGDLLCRQEVFADQHELRVCAVVFIGDEGGEVAVQAGGGGLPEFRRRLPVAIQRIPNSIGLEIVERQADVESLTLPVCDDCSEGQEAERQFGRQRENRREWFSVVHAR